MSDYTPYQKKIIKRYYDNAEAIGYQRISELTTEIFLAEGKKLDKLWKQVETALKKVNLSQQRIDHIMEKRDPKLLGQLVQELGNR